MHSKYSLHITNWNRGVCVDENRQTEVRIKRLCILNLNFVLSLLLESKQVCNEQEPMINSFDNIQGQSPRFSSFTFHDIDF